MKNQIITLKPELSAEEEAQLKHLTADETKFLNLAEKTYAARDHLATSYRDMVSFAATAGLEPKRITLLMRAAGFVETRISEFKTIALDPEATKRYTTGQIGFKPALEEARAKKSAGKPSKKSKANKAITKITLMLRDYVTANPSYKSFSIDCGGFIALVVRKDATDWTSQPFKTAGQETVQASVKISPVASGQK